MSAFFLFVEYARAGLLLVTPELAAAGFSGLVTAGGRGGIDGGSSCFSDFGGGDSSGPIGSGGFGTHGGNGGCDVSALRLGEVCNTNSALGAWLHLLRVYAFSIFDIAFQALIPYFGFDV